MNTYKSCYEIPTINFELENFTKALNIFTSQIVYCPITFNQIPLDKSTPDGNCGDIYSELVANLTVKAFIDPNTLLPF